jgi:hypothetical protein
MTVSNAHSRVIFLLVNLSALCFSTVQSFAPIASTTCQARKVAFFQTTTTTTTTTTSLRGTTTPEAEPEQNNPNSTAGTTPPGMNEEEEGQAHTRFSKYAPDPNLETGDFRSELMDNMKADLERRRRENPDRGNQPAKSYLDSL